MTALCYSVPAPAFIECMQYDFMKNAALAVLLASPIFALLGTMVVGNRLVFFSDVLGHSALAGLGIGVLLGLGEPLWSMVAFSALLAVGVNVFRRITNAANDTILGVFLATVVALGVMILSRGGGFARFSSYLIGDILAVTPQQITFLGLLLVLVVAYWFLAGNALVLVGISPTLARSRNVPAFLIETSFTLLLAVVVIFSIRLVGILIINSLLILPAAAARNLASDMRGYTLWTLGISFVCGFAGLIASYYWGTAAGATIVLFAAACYAAAATAGSLVRRRNEA